MKPRSRSRMSLRSSGLRNQVRKTERQAPPLPFLGPDRFRARRDSIFASARLTRDRAYEVAAMQPSFLKSHGQIGAQREFELKDGLRPPPEAAALRAVLDFKFSLRLWSAVRFKGDSASFGVLSVLQNRPLHGRLPGCIIVQIPQPRRDSPAPFKGATSHA